MPPPWTQDVELAPISEVSFNASKEASPRSLSPCAPFACMWHRCGRRNRLQRYTCLSSRRYRSSAGSLDVTPCRLPHPAGGRRLLCCSLDHTPEGPVVGYAVNQAGHMLLLHDPACDRAQNSGWDLHDKSAL